MRILTILMTLFLCLGQSNAQAIEPAKQVLSNILTGYIQPKYADLYSRSLDLQLASDNLCASPSIENLEHAQSSFLNFAHSWAQIEWFRVGPVMSKNRIERILFYPDRKSTGLKQVQRALAKQDQTVTSIEALPQKSVAVQGLGALEFNLFGTGFEILQTDEGSFRCAFSLAVARNLTNISKTLSDAWADNGIATTYWLNPNDENPLFRTGNEALNVVLGTMVHGLEAIRDVRIGAFLKDEAKLDRPKSALMWRSENTTAMIANGLEGLLELFNATGFEKLLPDENNNLTDSIRFEFNQALNTINALQKPIAEILTSENERKQLEYLKLSVGFAMTRLDNDLSSQLGLSAGFSFGDGD